MSEEEKSMEGQRVLIVDDLEPNRLILEEIIKNMNCVPVLAESGQQALELVTSTSSPDRYFHAGDGWL